MADNRQFWVVSVAKFPNYLSLSTSTLPSAIVKLNISRNQGDLTTLKQLSKTFPKRQKNKKKLKHSTNMISKIPSKILFCKTSVLFTLILKDM